MTSEIATIMLCYAKNQNSQVISNNKLTGAVFDVNGALYYLYLQLTSSSAADEVELSTLLLATQLY